ncbi:MULTISPECIES: sensor histidine kinase [Streptomyces]|uniref:sensor histidine kinase n=1 Tax=Streptomyces TaxID=1883 RepID=UPI00081B2FAD|nr:MULTISPECIES: sensor histidine kinase [unclassified Streptomyces]MYQ53735.1 sensor histidine kinase [Streptomyces sp. SID4941]SCE11021.1 Histidine kinase [Streptomyces sp. PalvLS-984]SDB92739.1 Histidine kinase [Streptomyces sp. AmelKG-A3]
MSSTPAPLPAAVQRSWDASTFLFTGLLLGLAGYVLTFLVAAVLLFAAVVIGLPALPEAATLLRRLTGWERRRTAARLGEPHRPAPYLPLDTGELGERVRRVLTDPTTWRDVLWLPFQAVVGGALAYLAMVLWPVGLLVDGIALPVAHLLDRRAADEYGTPPPVRRGWVLRWHPVLADLSASWSRSVLTAPVTDGLTERVAQLTESRAGAVEAHGAELRRIERDLHDGAQARIVALSLRIGLARQLLDRDPAAARVRLDEAQDGADAALAELRHVVRGIHPPVLTDRGLAGAVRALAADVAVPVEAELDEVEDGRRLPAAIEAAAYFVIAEALTNISKHSGATTATVRIGRGAGTLRVHIGDDGHGGADERAGSGLVGIRRRVAALDGTTRISSPAGGPTDIEVELPCGS